MADESSINIKSTTYVFSKTMDEKILLKGVSASQVEQYNQKNLTEPTKATVNEKEEEDVQEEDKQQFNL